MFTQDFALTEIGGTFNSLIYIDDNSSI